MSGDHAKREIMTGD
jgi:hypothetical protein